MPKARSAGDKLKRDAEVVAKKAMGMRREEIARQHNITVRMVGKIWHDFRNQVRPVVLEEDALDVVLDYLLGLQAVRGEASVIGQSQFAKDQDKLMAWRLIVDTMDKEIALRQATGLLPKSLGRIGIEIDVNYVAEKIVTVLNAHDVPREVTDEILSALGGGTQN